MYIPLLWIQIYVGIALILFVFFIIVGLWTDATDEYEALVFISFVFTSNWFWTLLAGLLMWVIISIRDRFLKK
jgi:hypothetical protein